MHLRRATATISNCRSAVIVLLAVGAVLVSEQRAWAESITPEWPYVLIGGPSTVGASVPFLVADVAYAADHRWLPRGWAITQIAIGGGVNAVVAGWGFSIYAMDECIEYSSQSCFSAEECANLPPPREVGNRCGASLGLAIAATVFSVGFIAHGVASLVLYEPLETIETPGGTASKSQSAALRLTPDLMVARDGTTLVALRGAF